EVVVLLNRTRLFRHLPQNQKSHVDLAKACQHERFKAGDVIVRQGDAGNFFLAILEGKVSVTVDGKKVATWRDGADFGEQSLLHDEPRQATLQAVTDVSAVKITRERFWKLGLNRKLQFKGRKAIRAAAATTRDREPTPKTPRERHLIAEALLANENLQMLVTLDKERVQKMVDVAWKEVVEQGVDVMVEGDLADCMYVVQAGAFRMESTRKDDFGAHTIVRERSEAPNQDPHREHSKASSDLVREHSVASAESADTGPPPGHTSHARRTDFTPKSRGSSASGRMPRYDEVIAAGGSFGELALLYSTPRFATARAIEASVLWGINRKHFRDILMGVHEEKLQSHVAYLRQVGSLSTLQEEELKELAKALNVNTFQKGELIVQQGLPSTSLHIVYEGQVAVIIDGKETCRLRAHPRRRVWLPVSASWCCAGAGCAPPPQTSHVVEEQALLGGYPCRTDVRVVSSSARTLSLLRDSFEMLVGTLDDLENARAVRRNHRTSIRTAVHRAKTARLLNSAPERQAYREKVTHMRDLTKVRPLGSGQFGNVELWQHRDGRRFAMKILSKSHIRRLGAEQSIINEKNLMLMTSSPFLVRLFEAYSTPNALYLLLEFAAGGELHTVYNRRGFYGSEKHAKFYAAGVVLAFEHLHDLHIIHRDLKPENVLLDSEGRPKLADLGLAKVTSGTAQTFCGTPTYLAPEVIRGTGYTHSADWWSLGVLIYELLCGTTPFEAVSELKIWRKVVAGVEGTNFPEPCQGDPGDLIRALLCLEPSQRMPVLPAGLEDLQRHRWYRGFDWEPFRDRALRAPYRPKERDFDSGFNSAERAAPSADEPYRDDGSAWDRSFATVVDDGACAGAGSLHGDGSPGLPQLFRRGSRRSGSFLARP
ncbi:unnamed protein product, partial [Prorocentrum cordatum]